MYIVVEHPSKIFQIVFQNLGKLTANGADSMNLNLLVNCCSSAFSQRWMINHVLIHVYTNYTLLMKLPCSFFSEKGDFFFNSGIVVGILAQDSPEMLYRGVLTRCGLVNEQLLSSHILDVINQSD